MKLQTNSSSKLFNVKIKILLIQQIVYWYLKCNKRVQMILKCKYLTVRVAHPPNIVSKLLSNYTEISAIIARILKLRSSRICANHALMSLKKHSSLGFINLLKYYGHRPLIPLKLSFNQIKGSPIKELVSYLSKFPPNFRLVQILYNVCTRCLLTFSMNLESSQTQHLEGRAVSFIR